MSSDPPDSEDDPLRRMLLAGLEGPDPLIETRNLCGTEHLPEWTPPSCEVIQALVPDLEVQYFVSRGGMGAVYRCHDPKLNRAVALKFLPVELAHNEETLRRFRQEGAVMAALRHEHIVSVFSCIGEKEYHCLLMEFVEGQDLHRLIRESAARRAAGGDDPLPLVEGLRIFCEVCLGVQHAHEKGLLHRDLKPANILVDEEGRARVADFGLARVISREESLISMPGRIMGSLAYMAPEQIRAQRLDERTDVFALGVMLQEILTGGPPGPKPSSVRKEIPRELDRIVATALAQQPEDRWQTAAALGAAVQRVRRRLLLPRWQRAARAVALPLGAAAAVAAVVSLLPEREGSGKPVAGTSPVPVIPPGQSEPPPDDPPGTRIVGGQRLVPVPGTAHLFAGMCEVSVREFEEFVRLSGYTPVKEVPVERREFDTGTRPLHWNAPGRPQEPDHPITCLSWDDADAFCQWLTDRCRADGTLSAPGEFRLLTDQEWSALAGVPPDPQPWLWERTARPEIYPWGTAADFQPGWENHARSDPAGPDQWEYAAPVGSLRRNAAGFHDLGGNVREWVMDSYSFARRDHAARSSGFRAKTAEHYNLSRRSDCWLDGGNDTLGMRVVLDLKSESSSLLAGRAEAAVLAFHGGKLPPPGWRARAWVTADGLRLDLTRAGRGQMAALAGLPVTELLLGPETAGMDLAGMAKSLRRLHSTGPVWPRLETAAGAALEYVSISGSPLIRGDVRLEGLNAESLRGLAVSGVPGLKDLEPLRGAKQLSRLVLVGTGVTSLEPVAALPLREVETMGSPLDLEDLLMLPSGVQVNGCYAHFGPAWEHIHRGDHAAAAAWLRLVLDRARERPWAVTPDWISLRSAVRQVETSELLRTAAAWKSSAGSAPLPGERWSAGDPAHLGILPGLWHADAAWHFCQVAGARPVCPSTAKKLAAALRIVEQYAIPLVRCHAGGIQTAPGVWQWASGEEWKRSLWPQEGQLPWLFSEVRGSVLRPYPDVPLTDLWHRPEVTDDLRGGVMAEWVPPEHPLAHTALQQTFSGPWTGTDGRLLKLHADGRVNDDAIGMSWWCLAAPGTRTALLWEAGGVARSRLVLSAAGDSLEWIGPGTERTVCRPAAGP